MALFSGCLQEQLQQLMVRYGGGGGGREGGGGGSMVLPLQLLRMLAACRLFGLGKRQLARSLFIEV